MTQQQKKQILESIAAQTDGVLLPERVVEVASPIDHPLHPFFEWDDSKAAHTHRLEQARQLIRSVRVKVTVQSRVIDSVYYVQNPETKPSEPGYVALPRLLTEREMAIRTVAQEFRRALGALERATEIANALGLSPEIGQLVERVRTLAEELPAIEAAA